MSRHIQVFGLLQSPQFQQAQELSLLLTPYTNAQFSAFLQTDWDLICPNLMKSHNIHLNSPGVIVLLDGRYLGDYSAFAIWADSKFGVRLKHGIMYYLEKADFEYMKVIMSRSKKYVRFGISVGGRLERYFVVELDFKAAPKTCENFFQLSMGRRDLSYQGSEVHRIVQDGFIEMGLIAHSNQKRNVSIYGENFPDESYTYKHDKPGILGMSKCQNKLNGSVFYITLRPLPFLNYKNVAFGRVIEGMDTIKQIAEIPTNNQRPQEKCVISQVENFASTFSGQIRPQSHRLNSSLDFADRNTLLQRRERAVSRMTSTTDFSQTHDLRDAISDMLHNLQL